MEHLSRQAVYDVRSRESKTQTFWLGITLAEHERPTTLSHNARRRFDPKQYDVKAQITNEYKVNILLQFVFLNFYHIESTHFAASMSRKKKQCRGELRKSRFLAYLQNSTNMKGCFSTAESKLSLVRTRTLSSNLISSALARAPKRATKSTARVFMLSVCSSEMDN